MIYNQETHRFWSRYELVECTESDSLGQRRCLCCFGAVGASQQRRRERMVLTLGVVSLLSLFLALRDFDVLDISPKDGRLYEISFRQSHGYVLESKSEWIERVEKWKDLHYTGTSETQDNTVRLPYSGLRLPTSANNLPSWFEDNILIDFDCPNLKHILGSASSLDPKWKMCNPEMLTQKPDCIIYYSGPPDGLLWERSFLREFPCTCQIYVFDPTELTVVHPAVGSDGDICGCVHVQPWGLGSRTSDSIGERIASLKTLEDTMKALNHQHVDLLILNCAGCEWAVYDQITAKESTTGVPAVDQFLVQVNGMKDKSFFQSMALANFVLFHREEVPHDLLPGHLSAQVLSYLRLEEEFFQ